MFHHDWVLGQVFYGLILHTSGYSGSTHLQSRTGCVSVDWNLLHGARESPHRSSISSQSSISERSSQERTESNSQSMYNSLFAVISSLRTSGLMRSMGAVRSQWFIFSVSLVDQPTRKLSGVAVLSHSSSELSDTKLRRLWSFIPSSSLDVKVMHFLSSGKGDIGLLLVTCSLRHPP